jgi:hypothetical protein
VFRCLGRRGFRQDYRGVSHAFPASKTPVAKSRFRSAAPDVRSLGRHIFERIAVIFIAGETLRADNDAAGFGHGNGGLGPEFVLFVLFALADAANVRFVEAVHLVCVPTFLIDRFVIEGKLFPAGGADAFRQFARDVPR